MSAQQCPAVSVIMNVYNAEKYLQEAIDSVYAQTYSDWEVILWDNGSTDNTADIAQRYDTKLRYFHAKTCGSLGRARNYAIAQARGRYVAFLDYDDVWMPQKLDVQIRLLESNPALGVVYSNGYQIDAAGIVRYRFSDLHTFCRGYAFRQLLEDNFIPLPSAVLRKRVCDEIGLFRDFMVAEDYDFFLRVAYQHPIDYTNDVLFKYRWHSANISHRAAESLHKEVIEIWQCWLAQRRELDLQTLLKKELSHRHLAYAIWLLGKGRWRECYQTVLLSAKYATHFLSWLPTIIGRSLLRRMRLLLAKHLNV